MSVNKSKLVKSIQDRGNYSTVPNELWELSVSVKAKTAYCYLLAQSDRWNPGVREIADGISMSKNSAREAIRELEAAGMIEVDEGPHGLRNVYSFTAICDWTAHPNSAPACQNIARGTSSNFDMVGIPRDSGGHPTGHIQEESKKKKTKEEKTSYLQEEGEAEAKRPNSTSSWKQEVNSSHTKFLPVNRSSPITPKLNNGVGVSQELTPHGPYNKNYEEDTIAIQKTYDKWGLTKENPWLEFDEHGKPKKRSKV